MLLPLDLLTLCLPVTLGNSLGLFNYIITLMLLRM